MSDKIVEIRSDFAVDLIDYMGDDLAVCQAARVSTKGADSFKTGESAGLINFLMKNRHGSPFEHATLKFMISAPIFVWREFMRHRIGFSYNEQSGRYMEMQPVFYVPNADRPLRQVGKTGAYEFVPGTNVQIDLVRSEMTTAVYFEWARYQRMIEQGVANEVARMYLPLAIYSTAYVTCNARSIMSFLSLRTKDDDSTFKSYPMFEIERVAKQMEDFFAVKLPLTHEAFCKNGRVAP